MSTAGIIDTAELGSCDICGVSYILGSDDHNGDTGICWECDHGCEPVPAGVVFYEARFSGGFCARCETCGHVWAYWDCACELVHDCDGCAP